jgi:hypothetical protein
MSDSQNGDGLDHVKEEDDEDEDEEILKKKLDEEKRLQQLAKAQKAKLDASQKENDALQKKLKEQEE